MKINFLSCYSLDLIPNAIISVKCYALIKILKLKVICFFATVLITDKKKFFRVFEIRLEFTLVPIFVSLSVSFSTKIPANVSTEHSSKALL